MTRIQQSARPLRWYVYEGDVKRVVQRMIDVQHIMIAYDHHIGAVDRFGLAYSWNIPIVLREFESGTRNAFLRCTHCAQPGIIRPILTISGAALNTSCRHSTDYK
jgi:hypothetical protein